MVDTVIIGSDALDSRYIKKFCYNGLMSDVVRELKDGTLTFKGIDSWKSSNLTVPFTGQAWPTIYCGGGDEVHGINGGTWEKCLVNYREEMPPTIFDDISESGLRLASFRMPITYPPRDVNGWMVAGFPSAKRGNVGPEEVSGEIEYTDLPDDYGEIRERDINPEGQTSPALPVWVKISTRQFDMACDLMQETGGYGNYDVFCYGTRLPDTMGHYYDDIMSHSTDKKFDETRACRVAYKMFNSDFQNAIERFDPKKILVVSDHGFQRSGGTHSFNSVIMEYDRDKDHYGFDDVDSIVDFREYLSGVLDLEMVDDVGHSRRRESVLSDSERDSMKENLSKLGYL